MPPRGRGRKRKVGVAPAPAPEPGQVDDGDKTDDKEEEEEAENNNEEAASSSTKKARVDSNAVHKEFNQTSVTKLVTTGKKQKEVKVWSSACRHCNHVVPNKKPGHLESHLFHKHRQVHDMVEAINDERREEITKSRLPKSSRLDDIVDSYVDWLIDSGQTLDTSESSSFKNFVHAIDPDVEIPGRWAITTRIEKKYNVMKKMMEEFLKDSLRCHLTMDMWSNKNCRDSFIGITCHLFDPKRKSRKTFRLCLRPFNERHTSANIIGKVTEILDEFGIRHKVNYVCTDNGANIKKAMNDLGELEVVTTGVEPAVVAEAEFGGMVGQVQDEFHPVDPEEVESQEEDVAAYIKKLQAEYDDMITSPRQFNLKRIPCLAHTLQLPILKMFADEEGVFYDVLKKVNSEDFCKFLFQTFLFCTDPEADREIWTICCSQAGTSQALPALCHQECCHEVRNMSFLLQTFNCFCSCKMVDRLPDVRPHPRDQQEGRRGHQPRHWLLWDGGGADIA